MKAVPSILLACCFVFAVAANARATELRIQFQGPDRTKANIETAELLLIGWGWTEHVPLTPNGDSVLLDFEKIEAQMPEKFQNVEHVQLYVSSQSLAAVQSERFSWKTPTVDFRGGQSLAVRKDANQSMTVRMRRMETRRIRLLDDDAKPIARLRVLAYRFESRENHCGFLQGPLLKEDSTDAEGRLTVPDGDFKYAFKLEYGSHVVFTSPERTSPLPDQNYFTAFLSQPETVFRLHRFEPHPLELQVFVGPERSPGVWITDSLNFGTCGAASGLLGRTDGNGRLVTDRYYPEERDGICIVDDQGKLLWGKERDDLLQIISKPIEVRLPVGTRFGQTASPCPFP